MMKNEIDQKNWLDEEVKDKTHYEVEEIAPAFRKQKLEEYKEKQKYRIELFNIIKIFIVTTFVAAYCFLGFGITHPNTYSVVISSITIMVPLIITLALMRFLFGDRVERETRNVPSIMLNLIKEIREIVVTYINRKN